MIAGKGHEQGQGVGGAKLRSTTGSSPARPCGRDPDRHRGARRWGWSELTGSRGDHGPRDRLAPRGPADLFVAIRGGRDFLGDARDRGAATLLPHDEFDAMAVLGQVLRGRSRAHFVGVTGSTGKTSTKDILAALCATVAERSGRRSYNAELGVPLSARPARAGDGALHRRDGHAWPRPDRGAVRDRAATCRHHQRRRPVHLELVGSVDGVARSKAELVAALPPDGIAIVPESADLEPHLRGDIEILRVPPVDVELREDGAHPLRRAPDSVPAHLASPGPERARPDRLQAMDLPLDRIEEGAAAVQLSKWRGEELALPGGGFVVNDAYNANPASMEAALRHLAERGAGRRRSWAAWPSSGSTPSGTIARSPSWRRSSASTCSPSASSRAMAPARGSLTRRRRSDGARPCPSRPRRPRQGVPRGRARRHRPDPGERHALMVRVFIAGLIAMVVSVVIGPKFIEFLRRNELGQPIREDGPAGHVVKQGTPVMGGLLILLCALLPFLALSEVHAAGADGAHFLTVSCAAIRFLDDFIKVRHRRSLGLKGRWKLILLAAITIVVGFAVQRAEPARHLDLHPRRER